MPQKTTVNLDIEAAPTKELFIEMLTRDVALIPAIIDLADNCTDGARRVKPDGSWKEFEISIDASGDSFKIVDNCGGIPVKAAREYAFRFGRPNGSDAIKGAVGRFGVGMKRGLFKLGRSFVIRSTTADSQFKATIDVDAWAKDPEWKFRFDKTPTEGGRFGRGDQGTSITVTRLHANVQEQFQIPSFIGQLRMELTAKLEESIKNGMAIRVNKAALKAHVRQLIAHEQLKPARKNFHLPGRHGKVYVELWCGLGRAESKEEARREAGWYVFCNGRMLLDADKTAATGWGETDTGAIPGFHPQFNDFRGFAYLEADDAADLPWNTTKTALDTDHPIYRRVLQEMVGLARPVIDFFNKVKQEQDARRAVQDETPGPLEALLEKAHTKPLEKVDTRAIFVVPRPAPVRRKLSAQSTQRIRFERPLAKAEEVKRALKARTWQEVGEQVFDYYYSAECGDE